MTPVNVLKLNAIALYAIAAVLLAAFYFARVSFVLLFPGQRADGVPPFEPSKWRP